MVQIEQAIWQHQRKSLPFKWLLEPMPEDEVSQSFKRAGEAFERMPRKPFRLPFPSLKLPQAPAQMSKWFNTTSGFVTGETASLCTGIRSD